MGNDAEVKLLSRRLDWIGGIFIRGEFELLMNREFCEFCGLGAMVDACAVDCTSSLGVCSDGSWESDDYLEGVQSGCGFVENGISGFGHQCVKICKSEWVIFNLSLNMSVAVMSVLASIF